jgi:IclR family KDG regulon transcriptional repressor
VGDICPYHATAVGKSIAAYLEMPEQEALLHREKLPRLTRKTIMSKLEFKAELAKVRRQGYAINDEENVAGAFFVGAPVFDADNRVFASLSVSTPTVRVTPEKKKTMIFAVRETGARISTDFAQLGFRSLDLVQA